MTLLKRATPLTAFLVLGCSGASYYAQAVIGGAKLLSRRKPVQRVARDPGTPTDLRARLELALEIRDFASRELGLPDNKSYRTYADLERRFAVWTVTAAPEFSTEPKLWCYPVAGCVSYRGFFKRERADTFAHKLTEQNYDVDLGGVSAYSTLGWFADPILNTFIDLPEDQFAGLLFHELAHQVAYVQDDTTFNESFATAVELEGIRRWLAHLGYPDRIDSYTDARRREDQTIELMLTVRERLADIYSSSESEDQKRAQKAEIFTKLKASYKELKEDWGGGSRYDAWFEQKLNNAHLASVGAYFELVAQFQGLLEQTGGLHPFYDKVREIADLAPEERLTTLKTFSPPDP